MLCLGILLTVLAEGPGAGDAAVIACPGTYGGHLQGLATDPKGNIYWSFTVALVKTDENGALLKVVEAPSHQGDLTWADGKVYVAVNLGKFNEEPGAADSWVYVYNADDLTLLSKHAVPEVVHGAGGMDCRGDAFFVVGGLPDSYGENYVYEYDDAFRFVARHVVASGHTHLGIQTTCYLDGNWWFGCYEDKLGLLQADDDFKMVGRHDPNFSVGIAPWTGGRCLRGETTRLEGQAKWTGKAVVTTLPRQAASGESTKEVKP